VKGKRILAFKKLLCGQFIPLGQAPLRQTEKPATLGHGLDRSGEDSDEKIK
jgi:hypothetical protein